MGVKDIFLLNYSQVLFVFELLLKEAQSLSIKLVVTNATTILNKINTSLFEALLLFWKVNNLHLL